MKNIAILGSTGSIGVSTLKIVERYPDKFNVIALSAYTNVELLEKQIRQFKPKVVAVKQKGLDELSNVDFGFPIDWLNVDEHLDEVVVRDDVDCVVLAMRGSAALSPFLNAARAGKLIAPANKEALVVAGSMIMAEARKNGATIIPVDSEQSAIFQCLLAAENNSPKCIHLTASGGALRHTPVEEFDSLTKQQILDHPRWKMGEKITVDSANLMNKGFEVIEAQRLFDLDINQIKVIVHPEAIVHSMVEFHDGSVIAQLGITDMQLPIQYAMTYPERFETKLPDLNLAELGALHFEEPDWKKFPALALAFEVAKIDGTLPCVLNAADEVAVDAFLNGQIKFTQIFQVVEQVVQKHKVENKPDLDLILEVDKWSRIEANTYIEEQLCLR